MLRNCPYLYIRHLKRLAIKRHKRIALLLLSFLFLVWTSRVVGADELVMANIKLTKAALNEMGIRNPHDIAKRGIDPKVIVDYYSPQDLGRGGQGARWKVFKIGALTDPLAPWYEHGNKAFYPHGTLNKVNKESCRDVALAWAAREYGIKEWERSAFGSYHPKGTLAKLVE